MQRVIVAGLIGLLFGTGIAISGMANPAKVLNFFDVFGTWDPSLASSWAGARRHRRRLPSRLPPPQALLEARFHVPTGRRIDLPLIGGAAVFGIGWGIAGFCPGGAIPALGLFETSAWIFVGSMLVGIVAARTVRIAVAQRAVQNA
jgi:hypothetical protein